MKQAAQSPLSSVHSMQRWWWRVCSMQWLEDDQMALPLHRLPGSNGSTWSYTCSFAGGSQPRVRGGPRLGKGHRIWLALLLQVSNPSTPELPPVPPLILPWPVHNLSLPPLYHCGLDGPFALTILEHPTGVSQWCTCYAAVMGFIAPHHMICCQTPRIRSGWKPSCCIIIGLLGD